MILRGNSGSGKTTIAIRLRALATDLVIVSQDVVRREILGTRDVADNPSIGLIGLVARYALDRGGNVVVEGILHAPRYGAMLRSLVADHQGVSRAYVMDVPFEETLRRHATKCTADEFGEAEMRAWWHGLQLVDGLAESVIKVETSADAAAARVLSECGPLLL